MPPQSIRRGDASYTDIGPDDYLRAFLAAEAERRPALGSQARTVAVLKCFFRFLIDILSGSTVAL